MSADLHIHIFEGITKEDLDKFEDEGYDEEVDIKIGRTPDIWVGQVSWIKDSVPLTVRTVSLIIGECLPTIDEKMIMNVEKAFELKNDTGYKLAKKKDITSFLRKYMGKKVFTVSW